MVEPKRQEMTMQRTRIARWITRATKTLNINTYCFCTTTMVTRMHLKYTYEYITCLVLMFSYDWPSRKQVISVCSNFKFRILSLRVSVIFSSPFTFSSYDILTLSHFDNLLSNILPQLKIGLSLGISAART